MIYYISPIGENSNSPGLWKKIQRQMRLFKDNGYEVSMVDVDNIQMNIKKKIMIRLPFNSIFNWGKLLNVSQRFKTGDVLYVRYHYGDKNFLKIMRRIKKNNPSILILLEIPTFPYDHELKAKIEMWPFLIKDKFIRGSLKEVVDYVLTYSKDDTIYGISTVKLSNAADLVKIKPRIPRKENSRIINLVCVATLSFWHGYDRLILGAKKYYENDFHSKKRVIFVHIVGEGPELKKYKNMVRKFRLEKYVIFHGKLVGEALERIYDLSDIGIDSLGRHRSKVLYNSSLKGKEYGAKGLPILSGVETELDMEYNYKFYMRVPADDTEIEFLDIINFYDSITNENDQEGIISKIREFNEKKFDINAIYNPVFEIIENHVGYFNTTKQYGGEK